jgi:hypothetical protein
MEHRLDWSYIDQLLRTPAPAATNKKIKSCNGEIVMPMSTQRTTSELRSDQDGLEAISRETRAPIDEIERVYDEEFAALAADARITQFLGVLTTRRVRLKLRQH